MIYDTLEHLPRIPDGLFTDGVPSSSLTVAAGTQGTPVRSEVAQAFWEPLSPIGKPGNVTVERLGVPARPC